MSPRQITEGQNMHESAGTRTLMCEIIGEIPLPHAAWGKKMEGNGDECANFELQRPGLLSLNQHQQAST